MKDDPTIARIREARHKISERCGHDAKRLVEHYMKLQERHRERLLSEPSEQASTAARDESA
jgi:hypothetical protein